MIASESCPYVKTGGLADVVYSLAKEMAVLKEDVAIIIPLYNQARKKLTNATYVGDVHVNMSWRRETSAVLYEKKDGINFYFIENQHYFERDKVYGYDDDGERFAFYAHAAIEVMRWLGGSKAPDIIHIHDWQAGMVPCLIKENKDPYFKDSKFVLTIHNPAFQGILSRYALGDLYNLPDYLYESGKVKFGEMVSTLKAGIEYSDKITTVSPTHRNELLTNEGSMGLNNVLIFHEYDFCGFLNGIDYEEFNPEKDPKIFKEYGVENFKEGKRKNKEELCKMLGLNNEGNPPLYSLVSRVTWQKGMSLVFSAVHEIVRRGGNVVLLGSGEYDYECEMNNIHMMYPDKVAVYIGYNDDLAHKIYAGSDFFLMPSLFEPCGLGQMIAQRYGTLPIVRRVGGLKDSVINYDSNNLDQANGFGFDQFSEGALISTCLYAMDNYYIPYNMDNLVLNALKTDNSWKKSGEQYHGLYLDIAKNK